VKSSTVVSIVPSHSVRNANQLITYENDYVQFNAVSSQLLTYYCIRFFKLQITIK